MVAQPLESESLQTHQKWQAVLAPHGIGYRLKLLSQLMTRRFQERLDPFGLTPFHWVVLCCLWEEDGLATSGISDKLQQVGGTMTGVLDRMEDRKLIRRERDQCDRRIWRIWLTEDGRNLEKVLLPLALELREQVLQDIPLAEQELFSNLVDQAIANLM
jgi:MarR family transcriptional regulator, organic hydroperoxide resistance regulator